MGADVVGFLKHSSAVDKVRRKWKMSSRTDLKHKKLDDVLCGS